MIFFSKDPIITFMMDRGSKSHATILPENLKQSIKCSIPLSYHAEEKNLFSHAYA
jgi:hypothetical protein